MRRTWGSPLAELCFNPTPYSKAAIRAMRNGKSVGFSAIKHKQKPPEEHSSAEPYHDGEDDGSHGGFEDPEHGQADDLHQREEVDAAQRNVPQEDVVGLVLGWHEEELAAVPELRWDEG